jgi:heme-degrading monooxygenase HmoA
VFIAMNRFRVKKGAEEAFEQVWMSRDTHLHEVPGFVEFHLLKGPEHDDCVLYSSHTLWQSSKRRIEGERLGALSISCARLIVTRRAETPWRFSERRLRRE